MGLIASLQNLSEHLDRATRAQDTQDEEGGTAKRADRKHERSP
jgi:hypothetical protein